MTPYTMPPPSYRPPRVCTTCDTPISFSPVIGGQKWLHLTSYDGDRHDVTIRKAGYFDTQTGETVIGNPLRPVERG